MEETKPSTWLQLLKRLGALFWLCKSLFCPSLFVFFSEWPSMPRSLYHNMATLKHNLQRSTSSSNPPNEWHKRLFKKYFKSKIQTINPQSFPIFHSSLTKILRVNISINLKNHSAKTLRHRVGGQKNCFSGIFHF